MCRHEVTCVRLSGILGSVNFDLAKPQNVPEGCSGLTLLVLNTYCLENPSVAIDFFHTHWVFNRQIKMQFSFLTSIYGGSTLYITFFFFWLRWFFFAVFGLSPVVVSRAPLYLQC